MLNSKLMIEKWENISLMVKFWKLSWYHYYTANSRSYQCYYERETFKFKINIWVILSMVDYTWKSFLVLQKNQKWTKDLKYS